MARKDDKTYWATCVRRENQSKSAGLARIGFLELTRRNAALDEAQSGFLWRWATPKDQPNDKDPFHFQPEIRKLWPFPGASR